VEPADNPEVRPVGTKRKGRPVADNFKEVSRYSTSLCMYVSNTSISLCRCTSANDTNLRNLMAIHLAPVAKLIMAVGVPQPSLCSPVELTPKWSRLHTTSNMSTINLEAWPIFKSLVSLTRSGSSLTVWWSKILLGSTSSI
jgi:hypothetical protein